MLCLTTQPNAAENSLFTLDGVGAAMFPSTASSKNYKESHMGYE
jgi:hypothetical protein